jgi:hypothetical protein
MDRAGGTLVGILTPETELLRDVQEMGGLPVL